MKNLLSGRTQDSPAVLGRVGQGHSLRKAMQDGEAERETLSSVVWIKLLYSQTLHIHLQLIICYVLYPETQAFVEESSSALLNTEYKCGIYCVVINQYLLILIISS